MKILITGFEPLRQFSTINPSWEAVSRLADEIEGVEILKECIPIVYDKAEQRLTALIEQYAPDAVICVGQSGHDNGITVERIGINLDDFNVPDNDGNLRIDEKIIVDGPDAYFVTLPVRAMVDAIRVAGIPPIISDAAGTHLCNHVTYYTRHLAETRFSGMISGFIHVPLDMSQCVEGRGLSLCRYYMDVNVAVRGIEAAASAVAKYLKMKG